MNRPRLLTQGLVLLALAALSAPLGAQTLDENWTVTVNGRSVRVNPDGSFLIANIPVIDQFGPEGPGSPPDSLSDSFLQLSGTSIINGVTRQVFSEPFQIRVGETFSIGDLTFAGPPFLRALRVATERSVLLVGESVQLAVTGILRDGTSVDLTPNAQYTTYLSSNPRVATVGPDGLLTARGRGRAFITAENGGVTAVTRIEGASGTPRIRLTGLIQLPDGMAAAGASIAISRFGFDALANADGSFDIAVDALLDVAFSVVVTFESGGQRFSRTVELEAAEGLELIDLGELVLAAEPPADLFLQRVFETGGRPRAMAAGDIDGDGAPDIAAVNDSHSIGVNRNLGDGTFAPAILYNVGLTPEAVAFSDLDGDLDVDLAATSGFANTLSVLLNPGDGAFAAPVPYASAGGASIAVGDLDLDGDADLAVAGGGSGLAVLRNQGDGTFAARVPVAAAGASSSVALGDVSVDGLADIVVTGAGNPPGVLVLQNLGDATFAVPVKYSVVAFGVPPSVTLDDLDGDDVLDIATVVPSPPTAGVLLNLGSGTFVPSVHYTVGDSPLDVAAGDLDGDGFSDIAVANSFVNSASISTLRNRGDGTFVTQVPYLVGATPRALTLNDFDGDGDRDVAVANNANVQVIRNQGDGTLANHYVQYNAGGLSTSTALGDFDGDGAPDLALGGGSVRVMKNVGSGAFGTPVQLGAGILVAPNTVIWADLDGDGDADLAAADFNTPVNSVWILSNQGDGTFAVPVAYGVGTQPIDVAAGDLDGDGDADLVASNFVSRSVSVLRNQGDATFAAHITYAAGGQPRSLAMGDLDGDGDTDLAVVASGISDSLAVLRNLGDGTFTAPVTVDAGCNVISVALGDLDGDGDGDLAVGLYTFCSAVSVLRNQGGGTYAARVDYSAGTNPRAIALGDLDLDGAADLAVVNETHAAVSVLRNLGGGTFAPPLTYGTGADAWSFALGDLDGDGDPDLAVAHSNAERVSVLLNQRIK